MPRMAKASAALSHCSSPATPGLRAQRASTGGPRGLSLAFGMLSALEGASCPSLHDSHALHERHSHFHAGVSCWAKHEKVQLPSSLYAVFRVNVIEEEQ